MLHPSIVTVLFTAAICLAVPSCSTDQKHTKPAANANQAGKSGDGTANPKMPPAEAEKKPTEKKPSDKKPSDKKPSDKKYTAAEKKLAKAQFKTYCVTCHGTSGKGDGPASLALTPKPRNWTDVKWQESVTDEHIFKVIKDGGLKHGLSQMMAPNPMYGDNPGVLHALVDRVRSFKGK